MESMDMNTQLTEGLLDTPALARLLGLSPGGIRNMLSRNPASLPPPVRIGRRVRWRPVTVEQWLASHELPLDPPPRHRGRPRNGPDGFPVGGRLRLHRPKQPQPHPFAVREPAMEPPSSSAHLLDGESRRKIGSLYTDGNTGSNTEHTQSNTHEGCIDPLTSKE
jgi:predicted DNA-binding transcriptional regulator AlpA